MLQIRKMLRPFSRRHVDSTAPQAVVQRANRAAAASFDTLRMSDGAGIGAGGEGWARPEYGRYMATSPSVYAAVRLRAEAVTRPPLRVYRVEERSPSPQPSPIKGEGDGSVRELSGGFRWRRRIRRRGCWSGSTRGTPAPTCGAPRRSTCACGGRPSGPSSGARTASQSCGRCVPTAWR